MRNAGALLAFGALFALFVWGMATTKYPEEKR